MATIERTTKATSYTSQVLNSKNIDHLVALTKEKSYRMPSGLTREQRRQWAKTASQKAL